MVLPKIKVQVSIGPTEVSIKISDNGGGACFSQTRKWFNYLYSTARTPDASPTNTGGTVIEEVDLIILVQALGNFQN